MCIDKTAFLEANSGLAGQLSIEWERRINGYDRHDLKQECLLEMYLAIDRFDPSRGFPLAKFLWMCMRNRLRTIRREAGLIRTPNHLIGLIDQVRRLVMAGADELEAIASLKTTDKRKRLVRLALRAQTPATLPASLAAPREARAVDL